MANTDAPFGLRPEGHIGGGTVRITEYPMSTGIDSIGYGDPVRLTSGKVVLATAGTRVMGAFLGYSVTKSDGSVEYGDYYTSGSVAGGSNYVAKVTVDPNIVYTIQADDDTTPFSTLGTAVNRNVDLLAHAAADSTTKMSKAQLDASSLTSAVAQFRVLGLHNAPDNAWGGNEVVRVMINEHVFGVTGITGES